MFRFFFPNKMAVGILATNLSMTGLGLVWTNQDAQLLEKAGAHPVYKLYSEQFRPYKFLYSAVPAVSYVVTFLEVNALFKTVFIVSLCERIQSMRRAASNCEARLKQ